MGIGQGTLDDPDNPFSLLRGSLGSGKSTLVAERSAHYAAALMEAQAGRLQPDGSGPWPMRILLRNVAEQIPYPAEGAGAGLIWGFVEAEVKALLPDIDAHALVGLIRGPLTRQGFFCFDGFDEIPDRDGRRRVLSTALAAFAQELGGGARVVVTGRPHALADADTLRALWRFRPLTMAPLDPERIGRFVDRVYAQAQGPLGWDFATRDRQAEGLKFALRERAYLAELASRPLLLALIVTLHLNRTRLPEDRADLYQEVVELLLSRWQRQLDETETHLVPENLASFLRSQSGTILDRVQTLAYRLHERQQAFPGQPADATAAGISDDEILGLFARALPENVSPVPLLDFLDHRAGLLIRGANGLYDFPHRSCREYLAACHLVDTTKDPDRRLVELVRQDPGRWHEVFLLAVGKMRRGGMANALGVVERLLPPESLDPSTLTEGQWRDVALAVRALVELRAAERSPSDHPFAVRTLKGVIDWARRLIEGGRLSAVERANAADYLGQLGDPRPGVGVDAMGRPDIAWAHLTAGNLRLRDGAESYPVAIPAFAMACYPVTVAQYAAYLQAQAGVGSTPPAPARWAEQIPHPTRPVVGISWAEATAFCCWLAAVLSKPIRLPCELEWEYAARGETDRPYPWGSGEADALACANTSGSGIGGPSAVGIFPRGMTPEGAMDLAGNVWEWCCDAFDEHPPYEWADCDPFRETGFRTVRGGSWWTALGEARCSSRAGLRPAAKDMNVGLRPVMETDSGPVIAEN